MDKKKGSFHMPGTKYEQLQDAEDHKGQGVNHELPSGRDWDEAMDSIHFVLLRKWYYVGIATNVKKGFLGSGSKGMALDRMRLQIPDDLRTILKMRMSTFEELSKKIKSKKTAGGRDRDVWHFKTQWKEFPEGTMLIELYQKQFSLFSASDHLRRAFIIMDGKAESSDLTLVMHLINRVFDDKVYVAKIKKEIKKAGGIKESKLVQAVDLSKGRRPGNLVMELKTRFDTVIRGINETEQANLKIYFKKLKESHQWNDELDKVEKKLLRYFDKNK